MGQTNIPVVSRELTNHRTIGQKHTSPTLTLAGILLLTTILPTAFPAELLADPPRRAQSTYGKAGTTTPSSSSTVGRRQHRPPTRQQETFPRRLLPPAGSSGSPANTAPGFYQQLNTPQNNGQLHGGYVLYPPAVVPYAYYPYAVAPPSSHSVQEIPSPPPPQQQQPVQPVYVVNQPPATGNSAPPIYIVNPQPAPETPRSAPAPRQNRPPAPPREPPRPAPTEPVQILYRIYPEDAEVYLDGELLGTATTLNSGEAFAELLPGVKVLEVSHPEHGNQRLVFGVGRKNPLEIVVDLTTDKIGRRSRVR